MSRIMPKPAPPRLLIIWHSRTGASAALARAAAAAACAAGDVDVQLRAASRVSSDILLAASAYIFVGPENLASMSGAMKEMVDRNYYALLDQINGRPYALIIAAGSDGSGAVRQWQRITTGWRLKPITDPLIICTHADAPEAIAARKILSAEDLKRARDIGAAMANGLDMGIF